MKTLNQKLIEIAEAHEAKAWPNYFRTVTVETEWWNIYDGTRGTEYTNVRNGCELAVVLGY